MVLNRVEGTAKFYREDVDQGFAFREGLLGRRLVPALVMGSSSGGKVTKVTILSTSRGGSSVDKLGGPSGPGFGNWGVCRY